MEKLIETRRRLRILVSRFRFTGATWRRRHLRGNPSKIMCDAAVRRFVNKLLPAVGFFEIAKRCRQKFGAERAPGKSAIHRYWRQRVMLEQARRAPR